MNRTTIRTKRPRIAAIAALALLLAACGADDTGVQPDLDEPTALLAVTPSGGATDVDRTAPVVVEFDHAMMAGMEAYADLHEGDVTGPEIAGTWSMSQDRTRMTFTPDAALAPHTDHTIHLGGGMMDADGEHVDFGEHGSQMGGHWATEGMMGGGSGSGHMGGEGGHGDQGYHMGQGWEHPTNGSYGMIFTFTTGG